jgi:hypothetical protein
VTPKRDLPLADIVFPPADAEFAVSELPPQASGVLVNRATLAELRKRDAPSKEPVGAGSPAEGLLAVNRSETLRYVMLDGIAIAWLKPRTEQHITGLRPGRYSIAWRDFLGQELEHAKPVSVPARVTLGEERDPTALVE